MVIRKLNLKLVRDIRFSPWLFLGIVLVVTSGITLFDASFISYYSLGGSYNLTYQKLNMADFTVDMQSAPQEVVDRIRRIPGVKQVEGRVVEELEIEQELATKRVTGRIISLPDRGLPTVNTLHIVKGVLPAPGSTRELLLESAFAKYHGYEPDDFIYPVVDDDKTRFRISGIAMSPEYIYVIRSRDSPTPEPKQFGVMFMRKEIADRLFGTSGAVNQVAVTIVPGAQRARIMRQVEQLLRPYGADEPIPKEKQASYEVLQLDLEGFRNLAIFFPILFLSIASLSIYNLLSRMVFAQRAQIGFMRSIGYSRSAVLWHYVFFAALIGLLGSVVGTILGYRAAILITDLYISVVSVPFREVSPRFDVMASGVAISLGVAILAGLMPALSGARMTPAEAIRTEAPAVGRVPIIENLIPWLRRASYIWRLPFRQGLRSPKRTYSTVAGIASAIVLILVSSGLMDSTKAMLDFYFDRMLRYDAMVAFIHPQTEAHLSQVKTWKGVRRVEPLLQVPVKLVHGNREKVTTIFGVERDTQLFNLTSSDGSRVSIPRTGIAIGDSLMETLGLSLGQMVTLTLPEKTIPELAAMPPPGMESYRTQVFSRSRGLQEVTFRKQVRVARRTYQPVGTMTVMSIKELRCLFGRELEFPPDATSAVMVKADGPYLEEIREKLYNLSGAASVVDIRDTRQEINRMMETSRTFIAVMFGFAVALAFVVIFNATTMNVLERTRETASMRALGVGRWQIAWMVTIENLSTWAVGTMVGVPFGRWLAGYFVRLYESEMFHMQAVVFPRTYLWTVLGILLTVLVSQIPGIRYLSKLDLASATKEVGE